MICARRALERVVIYDTSGRVHAVRERLKEKRRGRYALATGTDAAVRLAAYNVRSADESAFGSHTSRNNAQRNRKNCCWRKDKLKLPNQQLFEITVQNTLKCMELLHYKYASVMLNHTTTGYPKYIVQAYLQYNTTGYILCSALECACSKKTLSLNKIRSILLRAQQLINKYNTVGHKRTYCPPSPGSRPIMRS